MSTKISLINQNPFSQQFETILWLLHHLLYLNQKVQHLKLDISKVLLMTLPQQYLSHKAHYLA